MREEAQAAADLNQFQPQLIEISFSCLRHSLLHIVGFPQLRYKCKAFSDSSHRTSVRMLGYGVSHSDNRYVCLHLRGPYMCEHCAVIHSAEVLSSWRELQNKRVPRVARSSIAVVKLRLQILVLKLKLSRYTPRRRLGGEGV
jgi:hypothetical protein